MPRFVYHAHALAFGGYLRRPVQQDFQPHACCVLPTIGGRASSRAESFRFADPAGGRTLIAYHSAESYIAASQSGQGERRTELRTVVRGLNVLDVLRAEELVGALTIVHRGDRTVFIDTEGSRLVGLTLGGKPLEIRLNHGLGRDASDYAEFRRKYPHLPESRGVTRHSLAQHPNLKFELWEAGYLDVSDFGRVYFCEWWAAPNRQGLIMLRLRLGSPAEGEVEVGALEADGHDYP